MIEVNICYANRLRPVAWGYRQKDAMLYYVPIHKIHTYLTLFVWEYKAVCCDGYAIQFISLLDTFS